MTDIIIHRVDKFVRENTSETLDYIFIQLRIAEYIKIFIFYFV